MNKEYPLEDESHFREISQIIWTKGDRISKAFYTLFFLGFILPAIYFLLFGLDYPFEIMLSYLIAYSFILLAMEPGLEACQNINVLKELINKSLFAGNEEANLEYFNEIIRFVTIHGKHNRVPGQLLSAIIAWIFFYGCLFCSVIIGYWLLPIVGGWTPIVFLVAIFIPLIILLRNILFTSTHWFLSFAQQRGYRLKELKELKDTDSSRKKSNEEKMKSATKQSREITRFSLSFISYLVIGVVIWTIGAMLWYFDESYYILSFFLIIVGTSVEAFAFLDLHVKRRKQMNTITQETVGGNNEP